MNLGMHVSKEFDKRQEWAQIIVGWWHEQDMYIYGKPVSNQARNFGQVRTSEATTFHMI